MVASKDPTRGSRRRRVGLLGCLVGLVVGMAWGAAPAAATVTDGSRSTTPYQYVNWDCGYPMNVVGVSYDQVQFRVDNHTGIYLFSDNYTVTETWTAADGRFFTLSANGLNKDVKAKPVGGSVYQFTTNQVGQPFVITNSSGVVVSRDRGNLSFTYTVDIASNSFVDFLGLKVAGPHPMFGQDLCLAVRPLTGDDSFRYLTARPIGSTSFPMGFYEYLPPSYQSSGPPSPLLIALNGYGENGDGTAAGLQILLSQGIPRFINVGGWPTDRPLVVVALQHVEEPGFDYSPCDGVQWGGSCVLQLQDQRGDTQPAPCTTADEVHAFVSYAVAHYNVDPKRVYVTGLSCGGYGAWEYLAKYGNQQVAAAVPASGEGRPAWSHAGCALGTVPIWAFAGALDDVVNPQGSIVPMTNLQACPGVTPDRARLTFYPDFGHDAWNPAYDGQHGDDIYSWMLAFTRP
jgi:predicted esterase